MIKIKFTTFLPFSISFHFILNMAKHNKYLCNPFSTIYIFLDDNFFNVFSILSHVFYITHTHTHIIIIMFIVYQCSGKHFIHHICQSHSHILFSSMFSSQSLRVFQFKLGKYKNNIEECERKKENEEN